MKDKRTHYGSGDASSLEQQIYGSMSITFIMAPRATYSVSICQASGQITYMQEVFKIYCMYVDHLNKDVALLQQFTLQVFLNQARLVS